jgi:hypothetical protein
MMGELEAAGYANLVKTRGDDGKATGSYWDVSECPVDRVSENPTFGKPGSIVSTDAVVSTETAVSTENRGATAAEQGAAKKGRGSSGQPKARKARDPGPWAAFRDQALTDYGQPSTGPTQALVTRIVKTAEYHGLDPGQASMAWGRWRSETLVNDTAKYHPLHLAAQSWGEWLAARKLAHQARLARAESREVNA